MWVGAITLLTIPTIYKLFSFQIIIIETKTCIHPMNDAHGDRILVNDMTVVGPWWPLAPMA